MHSTREIRECLNLITHTTCNFTALCVIYRSRLLTNEFNARGSVYIVEKQVYHIQ